MININKISLREFIAVANVVSADQTSVLLELPKPMMFGRYKVPNTLNELMLGELFALQNMTNPILESAINLFGCAEQYVMGRSTAEVFAFNGWIGRELQRIAKLFNSIPSTLSDEEKRAGVEKLQFGLFGIVDNYAKRMGIVSHDYVLDCVPWLTVWQCMKNDAEVAMYDRRLRKIYCETK